MRGLTSFFCLAVVAMPGAQTPSPPATTGKCLILGQIVDPGGAGVDGVVVTLQGGLIPVGGLVFNPAPMPGGPRRTLTNSNGQFVFPDLPAGSYSIDASKPGYVPAAYGRRKPGGLPSHSWSPTRNPSSTSSFRSGSTPPSLVPSSMRPGNRSSA